jgi:hypothetical protein
MKICPECNESFPDEMKYCDLDGTKLLREPGSQTQDQSRLWSLIGVGILVGAILIITISVLFSPRTPDTPAIARSAPVTAQTPQTSAPEQSANPNIVEELPVVETKKKEKPADANSNSAVNPKAAFKETEESGSAKPDSRAEPPETNSSESETEKVAPVAAKPKSETEASKSAPTSDPKSDKKKEADKKDEKKDEKKKGGLFRFFKKIFGKG